MKVKALIWRLFTFNFDSKLYLQAQNLHGAITSASKIKYSDHHLYVMKDEEANK